MKKNIVIVLLSVALVFGFLYSSTEAVKLDTAHTSLRVSGFAIWKRACQQAAAGDARRTRWCTLADEETGAYGSLSDAQIRELATDAVLKQMRSGRK